MAEGMDLERERTNQRVTTSLLSPSREGETPPRESSSPLTTSKCSSTQEHTESLLASRGRAKGEGRGDKTMIELEMNLRRS